MWTQTGGNFIVQNCDRDGFGSHENFLVRGADEFDVKSLREFHEAIVNERYPDFICHLAGCERDFVRENGVVLSFGRGSGNCPEAYGNGLSYISGAFDNKARQIVRLYRAMLAGREPRSRRSNSNGVVCTESRIKSW